MATEIDSLDYDISTDFIASAINTQLWNGRAITAEEALTLRQDIEQKLVLHLLSQEDLDQIAHGLAELGAGREIDLLEISPDGQVVQIGFKKTVSKIWRKHKVEILIGLAIVAIITTVAIVAACSASGAVLAGAGTLGALADEDEKQKNAPPSRGKVPERFKRDVYPELYPPETDSQLIAGQPSPLKDLSLGEQPSLFKDQSSVTLAPPVTPPAIQHLLAPSDIPFKNPSVLDVPILTKNGVTHNNNHTSYREMLKPETFQSVLSNFPSTPPAPPNTFSLTSPPPQQPAFPPPSSPQSKSWILSLLEEQKEPIIQQYPEVAQTPASSSQTSSQTSEPKISRTFSIPGTQKSYLGLVFTNGMNTTFEEARKHAEYIASMSPGFRIQGIYNQTHGPFIDTAEATFLNFSGYSPNTARLIEQTWTEFHKANKDNPNAKILHICHSQGAIHVYNALNNAPQEIRDRVIVVAVAPATIIPKRLCHASYNYMSRKDIVPGLDLMRTGFLCGPDDELYLEKRDLMMNEIIVLEPHPSCKDSFLDHDFQSATYKQAIERHINDYLKNQQEHK